VIPSQAVPIIKAIISNQRNPRIEKGFKLAKLSKASQIKEAKQS
jgi:hypothetical protein